MRSPSAISRAVQEPPPPLAWPPQRDEGFPFRTLLSMAAVQFSTGGLFLALTALGQANPATAWAGAIILAAAVLQGKLILKANRRQRAARVNPFRRTSFWRTLFVGTIASYLIALALGPQPETPPRFVAMLCLWYSITLLPIAADPRILEAWRRVTLRKIPRKITACVTISAGLLPVTELACRGLDWMQSRGWLAAGTPAVAGGFTGANLAAMNFASNRVADGRFHVAIVGDDVALGGMHHCDALARLESLAPGVRVSNFSVPNSGPRHLAAALSEEVLACRPDLVLAFVSPGDDVLEESAGSEWFDWRSLALARRFGGLPTSQGSTNASRSFLQTAGRELIVCRTPIDAPTGRRWQKALRHLDQLVSTCHRQNVDVALVIVPGEFQLNRVLLETLCRRMGYQPEELDLELPQRRLAEFAGSHRIPCVDLLPHLRLCEASPYQHETRQWNAMGTTVALETIAGWIQSRYGTGLPVAARMVTVR